MAASTHSGNLFIFGLGYSTTGIARQAQQHGWSVTSTARQPARFARLQSQQHRVIRFDPAAKHMLDDEGVAALASAQYVLSSIPPVAALLYDPVLSAQHKLLRQVCTEAAGGGGRLAVGYLSSTGVYGDWQGEWVDESYEARTATTRGLLRLEAEQAWVALAEQLQLPLTIFRLGGIYGPRRSVLSNLQSKGAADQRPSAARRSRQRYTSRCHVADVAQAVLADMQRRQEQQQQQQCSSVVEIVNVVDNEPAPRGDVEAYAQQLLQVPPEGSTTDQPSGTSSTQLPTQQQQQQQPQPVFDQPSQQQGRQRGPRQQQEPLEEKRVRNDRLVQLLQTHTPAVHVGRESVSISSGRQLLLAPTYREGLQLILDSTAPFEATDLQCLFDA